MILTGFGFLSRLHGLSIDNVVEMEMVLADGRIIIVSEEEHPGEYWIPLLAQLLGLISLQSCGGPSEVQVLPSALSRVTK